MRQNAESKIINGLAGWDWSCTWICRARIVNHKGRPSPSLRAGSGSRRKSFGVPGSDFNFVARCPIGYPNCTFRIYYRDDDGRSSPQRNPATRACSAASGRVAFVASRFRWQPSRSGFSASTSPARIAVGTGTVLAGCVRETRDPMATFPRLQRLSLDCMRADCWNQPLDCPAAADGFTANLRPHSGDLLPGIGVPATARYAQHSTLREIQNGRAGIFTAADHFRSC